MDGKRYYATCACAQRIISCCNGELRKKVNIVAKKKKIQLLVLTKSFNLHQSFPSRLVEFYNTLLLSSIRSLYQFGPQVYCSLGPILPCFPIEGKGHDLGYFFNEASCLAWHSLFCLWNHISHCGMARHQKDYQIYQFNCLFGK